MTTGFDAVARHYDDEVQERLDRRLGAEAAAEVVTWPACWIPISGPSSSFS